MHRHQLEKEHQYNKINKVIGIRILDFQAIKNDEDYFHKCRLYFADKEENKAPFKNESLEVLKLYFVELGKFKKDPHQIKDGMDKWIDVLRYSRSYDANNLPPHLKEEKEIKKALKATDILCLTEKEYQLYEGDF